MTEAEDSANSTPDGKGQTAGNSGQDPKTPGTGNPPKPGEAKGNTMGHTIKSPSNNGSDSASVFMPVKPKFGRVEEIEHDKHAAWTGGKLTSDWTGLEIVAPASIHPTHFRSTSISGQAKSLSHHIQGLEPKFSRSSNLQTFKKKVMKHSVSHGLDTISCVNSPATTHEVVSVIHSHSLFTLKTGKSASREIQPHFNQHCRDNDRDVKAFLLSSVDSELEKQLCENCDTDECTFVDLWMHLIQQVRAVSIDRFDKIKDALKARQFNDCAGENVESLASDHLADWKDLHGANLCDPNLSLHMLKTIMLAGGNKNKDLRCPLRCIKAELERDICVDTGAPLHCSSLHFQSLSS